MTVPYGRSSVSQSGAIITIKINMCFVKNCGDLLEVTCVFIELSSVLSLKLITSRMVHKIGLKKSYSIAEFDHLVRVWP